MARERRDFNGDVFNFPFGTRKGKRQTEFKVSLGRPVTLIIKSGDKEIFRMRQSNGQRAVLEKHDDGYWRWRAMNGSGHSQGVWLPQDVTRIIWRDADGNEERWIADADNTVEPQKHVVLFFVGASSGNHEAAYAAK